MSIVECSSVPDMLIFFTLYHTRDYFFVEDKG